MIATQDWHIITCEYPPNSGGVSDYTRLVARGLVSEGDLVHVWCPSGPEPEMIVPGLTIHRVLGKMSGRDLRYAGKCLNQFPSPRRLLVQWVPHGYGYRSMNLPFCLWLWKRARMLNDEVELMVHEPFLAFGEGTWKQDGAAAVHRIMTMVLLNAATRVWISIPAWGKRLRPYFLGRQVPMEWLPVPSNVECVLDPGKTQPLSTSESSRTQLTLGHFGTFGWPISKMLEPLIAPLLRGFTNRSLILMGRNSTEFRLRIVAENPELSDRIIATGEIAADELSRWICKCDVMIQPYRDGISSRRGSAMAALSHGLPIVTTVGSLTEDVWLQSGAVALVPAGDSALFLTVVNDLLANEQERRRMRFQARRFYLDRFDVRHTIHALRSARERSLAVCES